MLLKKMLLRLLLRVRLLHVLWQLKHRELLLLLLLLLHERLLQKRHLLQVLLLIVLLLDRQLLLRQHRHNLGYTLTTLKRIHVTSASVKRHVAT